MASKAGKLAVNQWHWWSPGDTRSRQSQDEMCTMGRWRPYDVMVNHGIKVIPITAVMSRVTLVSELPRLRLQGTTRPSADSETAERPKLEEESFTLEVELDSMRQAQDSTDRAEVSKCHSHQRYQSVWHRQKEEGRIGGGN